MRSIIDTLRSPSAGVGPAAVGAYWISVVHTCLGLREVTGGWSVVRAEVAEHVAIARTPAVATRVRPPTDGATVPAGRVPR